MLVLSRKLNQAIMIGENVKITVVEIREDHVRLGITAPREVPVYREEVYEKIKGENILASQISLDDLGKLQGIIKPVSPEGNRPPDKRKPTITSRKNMDKP
jgi:carbon storage regulator